MTEEKSEVDLDTKYSLRGLKRGELKRFKAKGFFLQSLDELNSEKQDEFIDMVNEAVMGVENAEELTVTEGLKVFKRIIELTYRDEEKNFLKPGAGTKAVGKKKPAKRAKTKPAKRAKTKNLK